MNGTKLKSVVPNLILMIVKAIIYETGRWISWWKRKKAVDAR